MQNGNSIISILLCLALFDTAASFSCYSCNSLLDRGCETDQADSKSRLEPFAVECKNLSTSPFYEKFVDQTNYVPACMMLIVRRQISNDQYEKKRLVELVHMRTCSVSVDNQTCELLVPVFQNMNTILHLCETCNSSLCNHTSGLHGFTVLWPTLVCLAAALQFNFNHIE